MKQYDDFTSYKKEVMQNNESSATEEAIAFIDNELLPNLKEEIKQNPYGTKYFMEIPSSISHLGSIITEQLRNRCFNVSYVETYGYIIFKFY